jgi:hypothetical protein
MTNGTTGSENARLLAPVVKQAFGGESFSKMHAANAASLSGQGFEKEAACSLIDTFALGPYATHRTSLSF